jgi:hypothetical protein
MEPPSLARLDATTISGTVTIEFGVVGDAMVENVVLVLEVPVVVEATEGLAG